MDERNNVARTIWQQMKAKDTNLCMCMGVHKLVDLGTGLQFHVDGLKFKGVVQVIYNYGKDLYDLNFLLEKRMSIAMPDGKKSWRVNLVPHKKFEEVYAENMMEIMEAVVELGEKELLKDVDWG